MVVTNNQNNDNKTIHVKRWQFGIWSLAMVMGDKKMDDSKIIHVKCWQLRLPCGCGGVLRDTSTNGAHPGLHLKPLDAAIGQVPLLHRPGSRIGQRIRCITQNTTRKLF
jgi:hypothetical protein